MPTGFAPREPFVTEWVLDDSRARATKRAATPYASIKACYDALLPVASQALQYFAGLHLGALDDRQERLLKLLLSLAEVGPSVEWYGQPTVVDGFPAHRFQLTEHIPDNTVQEYR